MSNVMDDRCLFDFKKVCDRLNIKCFLMLGTALGFYRDNGFCKGDFDLDVGVICTKEELSNLFIELMGNEFVPGKFFLNPGWEMNLHFHKYGTLFDVYFQFLDDVDPMVEKFDIVEYKGVKFNVPSPIEEYLELEYGPTWKTPELIRSRPFMCKKRKVKLGGVDKVVELSAQGLFHALNSEGKWKGEPIK